jgi:hypothetical protein
MDDSCGSRFPGKLHRKPGKKYRGGSGSNYCGFMARFFLGAANEEGLTEKGVHSERNRKTMCHELISGSIGLWLLVSAFTLATGDRSNLINCLLVGIVLIGVGSWAGISYGMWHDWIIAGLGIWMMISGKILSRIYRLREINYIGAALVVTIASSWHCFFRS